MTGVVTHRVTLFGSSAPRPGEAEYEFERLAVLTDMGDLFVVLPGSTGTLLELALVWEMLCKGLTRKPVLADAVWEAVGASSPPGCPRGGRWPAEPDGCSRDSGGPPVRFRLGRAGASASGSEERAYEKRR